VRDLEATKYIEGGKGGQSAVDTRSKIRYNGVNLREQGRPLPPSGLISMILTNDDEQEE